MALVSGANRGIGAEMRASARRRPRLRRACRRPRPGQGRGPRRRLWRSSWTSATTTASQLHSDASSRTRAAWTCWSTTPASAATTRTPLPSSTSTTRAAPWRPTCSAPGGSPRRRCRCCATATIPESSTSPAARASSTTCRGAHPAYRISKSGLNALTRILAAEEGRRQGQLALPRLGPHRYGRQRRPPLGRGRRRHRCLAGDGPGRRQRRLLPGPQADSVVSRLAALFGVSEDAR